MLDQGAKKQEMRNAHKLRTFAGRLRRDIGRKTPNDEGLNTAFADILALVDRVIVQRKRQQKQGLFDPCA